MALTVLAPAVAAASAPDIYFGDGGTSAFYTWNQPMAGAGRMLRHEAVGDGFHAENAALAERILYSSTDGRFGRGVVEASGLLYLPKGKMPRGGWPLLVWGHGTFGIADVCAPSWSKPNERDGTFIDAWLRQGYAVVAPDYQGLGTRGVHPYLQRKPEGYSTLDAARAALAAHPKQIANRVILAGQSQGSGAVLNATYLAKGYAPSLNILGTVATALVWRAPGTSNPAEEITGSDSARYMIMRMMSGGLPDSAPAPDALLTDKGALLRETASAHCSRDLVPVARDNAITSTNAVNIPAEKVMTMLSSLDMPPGRLTIPIFIGTGRADEAIAPQSQYRTVREMCRRGDRIIWHTYSGVGHSATSISALRDSIPFANALLKGAKPSSTCASIADPGARQAPARDIPFNN